MLVSVNTTHAPKCHHSPSQSHCYACSSGVHLWCVGNELLLHQRVGGLRAEEHGNPDYCTEMGDQTLLIGCSTEVAAWSSLLCDMQEVLQDNPMLWSWGNPVHIFSAFGAVCSAIVQQLWSSRYIHRCLKSWVPWVLQHYSDRRCHINTCEGSIRMKSLSRWCQWKYHASFYRPKFSLFLFKA